MSKDERVSLKNLLEENDYLGSGNEEIVELPLNVIKPNPYQPRYVFDNAKIDELAKSIKEHGVFSPIVVKKSGNDYIIISGERRYRACQKLKMDTIPAIVRMYEKSKMIELALVENLQREDLTPVEEAKAYLALMKELSYNQTDLAKHVGKSRSYVTNMLGILNLPESVLKLVDGSKITMGHARALSKISDEKIIKEIARRIVDEGLSVRDVEDMCANLKKKAPIKRKATKRLKEYVPYEKAFGLIYKGSKLKVSTDRITISVDDKKDIQEILDKLIKK